MINPNDFKNCSSKYRSMPFWSWNDKVSEEELINQIHEMYKQGMGGFFMHPRAGMKDEYLGDSFMEAVRACAREAGKLGMEAWLYDEDRFPSGTAGGMVAGGNRDYRQKALVMHEMPDKNIEKTEGLIGIFLVKDNDESIEYIDVTSMKAEEVQRLEGQVIAFEIIFLPGRLMFNGESFSDLCYKPAVDAFIEITHEKYKAEAGSYFGSSIPGIFTDEPHFEPEQKGRILPWSLELREEFINRKGYDIYDVLPGLFLKAGDYKMVRFDFWDVISAMFVEAFSKNIYDWCTRAGIKFTGHYWDHIFPSPKHTGSTMPNYEFMHYPGIDMLFNTEEEVDQVGNVLIVKEVSSVGNQLGKERVLSETYGASGWDLHFRDQKKIADWQFALGINFVCQHLVHYSLKGYRKRDFPLSYLQQPWWKHYRVLGDYIGRVSYALSQGEYQPDILVLHPYSSVWTEFDVTGENTALDNIKQSFQWLNKVLCELHYSFDLGDETIMERYGTVENARLVVGKMSYSTVILPHVNNMRSSCFKLLKAFAGNGGAIITTGGVPSLLDGKEDIGLESFFNNITGIRQIKGELAAVLSRFGVQPAGISDIHGRDTSNIYFHKRVNGDKLIYFLCNIDKERKNDIRLSIDAPYKVEEWDALTGETKQLEVFGDDGKYHVELELYPVQSHLLIIDSNEMISPQGRVQKTAPFQSRMELLDWKAERQDYNAYTIKQCQYRLDSEEWSETVDVLEVDSKIGEKLGLGWRGVFSKQPWAYDVAERAITGQVDVRYEFDVSGEHDGRLFAAVESPEEYEVFINGNNVKPAGGYYIDKAFVLFDIKDYVIPGGNEIILSTVKYNVDSAIESIYIVGDFCLEHNSTGFLLKNEDAAIMPGDWTEQGYPYYSGTMEYSTSFNLDEVSGIKAKLVLGELWMAAARVIVNGSEVQVLGWEPYELDISGFIKSGINCIELEVMNSLQNLLGPHSSSETKGFATPGSFYYTEDTVFSKSGFDGKAYILTT